MDLQEKLSMLPTAPGVYLMKNEAGEVIYVGKAVSLRSRVRSYFQKSAAHPLKVQVMVEHIHDFEYIVTDSEVEALILENHLIKEYAPRYNVRLKDDKTYPYIKVTVQEDFPRVLMVRRRLDDGARYFGPYTDVSAVKKTLSFLRTLFPVRTCSKKIVEGQQDRPCLNYHIGRCLGPCAGLVSGEKYREMIEEVIMFLEGRIDRLLPELTEKMQQAAAKLEFEKAARFRNQIRGLQALAERQKMVAQHHEDQDYVGYARWGSSPACRCSSCAAANWWAGITSCSTAPVKRMPKRSSARSCSSTTRRRPSFPGKCSSPWNCRSLRYWRAGWAACGAAGCTCAPPGGGPSGSCWIWS